MNMLVWIKGLQATPSYIFWAAFEVIFVSDHPSHQIDAKKSLALPPCCWVLLPLCLLPNCPTHCPKSAVFWAYSYGGFWGVCHFFWSAFQRFPVLIYSSYWSDPSSLPTFPLNCLTSPYFSAVLAIYSTVKSAEGTVSNCGLLAGFLGSVHKYYCSLEWPFMHLFQANSNDLLLMHIVPCPSAD